MVQSYDQAARAGQMGSAPKYADIQFVIAGRERMGIASIERMKTQTPYDAERDLNSSPARATGSS